MNYKFNEKKLIEELQTYVDQTYDQHYATDKYQATDVIIDSGHGTGFCLGNVIKYAKRYGNKGTPADARKDILKILHYALIQLDIHDQENKVELSQGAPGHFHPSYTALAGDRLVYGLDGVTPEEWDRLNRVKGAPLCG